MLPKIMTAIVAREPGGPEVLDPGRAARARAGSRRGADRGRGRRHQPPRRASAPGSLSAAERRFRYSRHGGCRQGRSRRLRRRRDSSSAIAFARSSAAAAMPSTAWRPETATLPVPQGLRVGRGRGVARGRVHRLAQCVRARRAQARRMAAGAWRQRAASAPPRSRSAAALGAKVMATVGSAEKVSACEALGAVRADQLPRGGFRRGGARDDRRPWRRRHPRHGRRRLYRARSEGRRARGPHRADRLPQGRQGRDRPDAADAAAADAHRLDAPRAKRRGQGAHGAARSSSASGRWSPRAS